MSAGDGVVRVKLPSGGWWDIRTRPLWMDVSEWRRAVRDGEEEQALSERALVSLTTGWSFREEIGSESVGGRDAEDVAAVLEVLCRGVEPFEAGRQAAESAERLFAALAEGRVPAEFAWAASERRFLQVVTHGESVRVFVDDRQVIDASTSFNAGSAGDSGATRHGLYCSGEADHVWRSFGGWVSLFRGVVDTIHPRPRLGAQYCYVRALDDMERLTSVTLHTQATSAYPQTSDEILGDVLDRSGAEAGRRMDTGAELVPRLWSPPLWGVRALDTIYRLQDEEDGLVYVDGHGLWRLESRTHRASAPHTGHVETIEDAERDGRPYFSELVWDDGIDNVENSVFMQVRGATFQGAKVAWTLSEQPYFAAGETKLFLAESSAYDMLIGQLRPRRNTDYTANTRQDGTGTDISSQLSVSYPSQREYRGKGTLVSVRFGSTAGYLTKLQMRTLNAYTFDDPVIVRSEDAASVTEYGRRVKRIDAVWTREAATAQATVDSRLRRRRTPRSVATVALNNGSGANVSSMLQRGFSDRVRLRYPAMGIDADFFVEGRRLSVGEGWTRVECELLLQRVG